AAGPWQKRAQQQPIAAHEEPQQSRDRRHHRASKLLAAIVWRSTGVTARDRPSGEPRTGRRTLTPFAPSRHALASPPGPRATRRRSKAVLRSSTSAANGLRKVAARATRTRS